MNSIQKKIIKIASNILEDYEYIYDPDHKKNLGEGFERTEKGWSKDKSEKKERGDEKRKNFSEMRKLFESFTTTESRLHHKALSENVEDRREAASDEETHQFTLDLLSRDKNREVREDVAQNKYTPQEILDRLAGGDEAMCVAENPNTHPKTLDKLSNHEEKNIRFAVAENPNTYSKTLKNIIKLKNQHWDYEMDEVIAAAAYKNLRQKAKRKQKEKNEI